MAAAGKPVKHTEQSNSSPSQAIKCNIKPEKYNDMCVRVCVGVGEGAECGLLTFPTLHSLGKSMHGMKECVNYDNRTIIHTQHALNTCHDGQTRQLCCLCCVLSLFISGWAIVFITFTVLDTDFSL